MATRLTGPETSAAYEARFGEQVWRHSVPLIDGKEPSPALRDAFDGLGEAWSAAVGVRVRILGDIRPEETDFARRRRLYQQVAPKLTAAVRGAERATAQGRERAARLRSEAVAQLGQGGRPELLAEARAILRALPEEQRVGAVQRAIETGDALLPAAVLTVPAYMSGIDEGRYRHLLNTALARVAGDRVASAAAIEAGAALVERTANMVRTWMQTDFAEPVAPGPVPYAAA